jgi:hypothetical protein
MYVGFDTCKLRYATHIRAGGSEFNWNTSAEQRPTWDTVVAFEIFLFTENAGRKAPRQGTSFKTAWYSIHNKNDLKSENLRKVQHIPLKFQNIQQFHSFERFEIIFMKISDNFSMAHAKTTKIQHAPMQIFRENLHFAPKVQRKTSSRLFQKNNSNIFHQIFNRIVSWNLQCSTCQYED